MGLEGKIIHATINKKMNLTIRGLNAGSKWPGWLKGCGGSGGSKMEVEGGLQQQWKNSGSGQQWKQQMARAALRHEDSWRVEKLFRNFMQKNFDVDVLFY